MDWLSFYQALPSPSAVKDFYVRGYTEASAYYPGVRVVPSPSFCEGLVSPSEIERYQAQALSAQSRSLFQEAQGLSSPEPDSLSSPSSAPVSDQRKLWECLCRVGFPCYLFPCIDSQNQFYGAVLKGYGKLTPLWRANSSPFFLGNELVTPGSLVYLVEGIKDSYILRACGCRAVPMLTSTPSRAMAEVLGKAQCRLVLVSDNDRYRSQNENAFIRKMSLYGVQYLCYDIQGNKDLGEFFDVLADGSLDLSARRSVLANVRSLLSTVKQVFGEWR